MHGFDEDPFADRNENGMYDPMDRFDYETYNGSDEEMLDEIGRGGEDGDDHDEGDDDGGYYVKRPTAAEEQAEKERQERESNDKAFKVLTVCFEVFSALYTFVTLLVMPQLGALCFPIFLAWNIVMMFAFKYLFKEEDTGTTKSHIVMAFVVVSTLAISFYLFGPINEIQSEFMAAISPLLALPVQIMLGRKLCKASEAKK